MIQSIILCFFIMCGLKLGISTLRQPGCGKQNKSFSVLDNSRIVGGSPAQYMEYPWIVLIRTFDITNSRRTRKCTGSIIHPKFILTAGHCLCVLRKQPRTVLVGAGHVEDSNEKYQEIHRVQEEICHPQFEIIKETGPLNDIALAKLEKPINLGPRSPLRPICLPTRKDKYNRKIIAAGFGREHIDWINPMPMLMKVDLTSIDIETCKQIWRQEEINYKYNEKKIPFTFSASQIDKNIDKLLTDRTLCTYDKLKSFCQGDSGSPGMCINTRNNLYYICGVASFVNKLYSLSIYMKVSKFSEWITNSIIENSKKTNMSFDRTRRKRKSLYLKIKCRRRLRNNII